MRKRTVEDRQWKMLPVVIALLVAACGGTPESGSSAEAGGATDAAPDQGEDERLQVVVTMSVLADLVDNVAGDVADVTSVVPTGGDPHVFEPRPEDARNIADAHLVITNGAGLEPWYTALEGERDGPTVALADELTDQIVPDEEGEPDPHLWMVPPFAATYVERIGEALGEVDPAHAETYAAQAADYTDELDDLDAELAQAFTVIPTENRVLITSHDAYSYFADHYDFEVTESVVGVTTEEEPSAQRVREVVEEVRANDVPTIFVELTVNPSVIEQVAREADVEVGRPLYGDSVGEEGSGAETYIEMMRANADALVDGLAP